MKKILLIFGTRPEAILIILLQVSNKSVELFYYSNEGVCSWYDFAKAIFEIKEISIKVKPIESAQYPTTAERPFYSVLNTSKIKNKFDIEIPYCRTLLTKSIN